MELKDYTTEELKAELKRRAEEKKAQKAEEMRVQKAEELNNALRCWNCKHCVHHPMPWVNLFKCEARIWGKSVTRYYSVKPSQKACDKFEHKMEE